MKTNLKNILEAKDYTTMRLNLKDFEAELQNRKFKKGEYNLIKEILGEAD